LFILTKSLGARNSSPLLSDLKWRYLRVSTEVTLPESRVYSAAGLRNTASIGRQ